MSRNTVEDTMSVILELVQDAINMPLPQDVGPGTALGPEGLGVESLAMIELILGLERRYGVSLPDEDFEDGAVTMVADLVAVVDRHRAAAAGTEGL